MVRLPFIKYHIALRYRQIFATIIPGVQPVKNSSDRDSVINRRELCRTSDEDSVVNRLRIPRSFDRDSVIIQPMGRNIAF